MYCEQVRQALSQNDGKQHQQYTDALFDHLAECPQCWQVAEKLWQREIVDTTGKHHISRTDVDRILDEAWNAHSRRNTQTTPSPVRAIAAAAMVIVTVSAVLLPFWSNDEIPSPRESSLANTSFPAEPATIVISPDSEREVRFMLTSARSYSDARITLALGENLTLSGYPGLHEISWPTSLQAGDNQLTLPLQLLNDEHGNMTVHVESEGLQKQVMFTVQPPVREQNPQVI